MTRILAWHFLRADCALDYGDGRIVRAGESLSVDVTPVLCARGLHASPRILDALSFRAGPIVCRVRVSGDVVRDTTKIAGRRRECLWMVDATPALRMFAIDCRARQIEVYRRRGVRIDPRADAAIRAAYGYLAGSVTLDALHAARSAAYAYAAYAADAVAVAAVAAYAADYAAAAVSAVSAAAVSADVAAVADAADAADAAERAWQSRRLRRLIGQLRRGQALTPAGAP